MSDLSDLDPQELSFTGARCLLRNGLMQGVLDANHFQILNLDTSNLSISAGPNTLLAVPHFWVNAFDADSLTFGTSQPSFTDIAGVFTTAQKQQIDIVGTIRVGTWNGTVIAGAYLPTLNLIHAPVALVSFNQQRLTNLADAIGDQDAVNLRLVNERLPGLKPKAAVVAASTDVVVLSSLIRPVDGITLNDNDRVLVKDQGTTRASENCIYDAHAGPWTRSVDADTGEELNNAITFVNGGTVNAGTTWLQTADVVNIGTDPVIWEYYSAQILVTAGAGLGQAGNTIFAVGTTNRISIGAGIDISAAYVGQTSITTLGTITSGAWNATVLDPTYGGTGINNGSKTIGLVGNFATAFALGNVFDSPLTFNLHGPTTLTLPLSGQVASLAGSEDFTNKTWTGKHIVLAGDLTTTLGLGAPVGSTVTFTLSGITVVTLPLTGTLATIAGNEIFTNKHISGSQIDSGAVGISHGGTGATTSTGAINNLLPDQTGNAGKTLHTDGTNVFWS